MYRLNKEGVVCNLQAEPANYTQPPTFCDDTRVLLGQAEVNGSVQEIVAHQGQCKSGQ